MLSWNRFAKGIPKQVKRSKLADAAGKDVQSLDPESREMRGRPECSIQFIV